MKQLLSDIFEVNFNDLVLKHDNKSSRIYAEYNAVMQFESYEISTPIITYFVTTKSNVCTVYGVREYINHIENTKLVHVPEKEYLAGTNITIATPSGDIPDNQKAIKEHLEHFIEEPFEVFMGLEMSSAEGQTELLGKAVCEVLKENPEYENKLKSDLIRMLKGDIAQEIYTVTAIKENPYT